MNLKSGNKKVWVKVIPWNKEMITTALESGADALMVSSEDTDKVKALGVIKVISSEGDIRPERDFVEFEIHSSSDEAEIVELTRSKIVIVRTSDWTIIPLENLIAQTDNLFVEVRTLDEAKTSFGILEKGVDGIVIGTEDLTEMQLILKWVKGAEERTALTKAVITEVRPLAMGDRICIDTCSLMGIGEGMLVGNSSSALFLIHSESIENPYVEARPFRVNAGPVHAYIRVPHDKTRYLSELKSGDEVLIVNYAGEAQSAIVGRIKRERRPLIYIEAMYNDKKINVIVQNAETIRLTRPDGQPLSVVELKEGDEVLVAFESTGRHFGHAVQETIEEK
jgi:3-dehydroquinate synthase II